MPLYEYECDLCRHRFEVIQKFSDQAIDVCPSCGHTVHKLFSSPAIQFKGAGWYVNDYAKKGSGVSSDPGDCAPPSTERPKDAERTKDAGRPDDAGRTKDVKSSPSASSSSSSPPADKVPAGSSSKDS